MIVVGDALSGKSVENGESCMYNENDHMTSACGGSLIRCGQVGQQHLLDQMLSNANTQQQSKRLSNAGSGHEKQIGLIDLAPEQSACRSC